MSANLYNIKNSEDAYKHLPAGIKDEFPLNSVLGWELADACLSAFRHCMKSKVVLNKAYTHRGKPVLLPQTDSTERLSFMLGADVAFKYLASIGCACAANVSQIDIEYDVETEIDLIKHVYGRAK